MQLKILFLIGVGGFLGSILRYLLSQAFATRGEASFPFGTFLVNIIGCLLIGIAYGFFIKNHTGDEWRFFITTGLLGGFTTYSAFSMESVLLMKNGHIHIALFYMLATLVVGTLATFSGIWISKML